MRKTPHKGFELGNLITLQHLTIRSRLIVTYKNSWIKELEGHPFLYSQINNNN